jgi:hypothetical protein
MLCPKPDPGAILHWMVSSGEFALFEAVPEILVHLVEPMKTLITLSITPKFVPLTVKLAPPAAGWF